MRIVVIPAHFSYGRAGDDGMAGVGRNVKIEAAALAKFGHDVTLLYTHFDADQGVRVEETEMDGVHCVYVHAKPLPLPGNLIFESVLMMWAFRHFVLPRRPEIIHAYSYRGGLHARPISKLFGIPYLLGEHSPLYYRQLSGFWAKVAKFSFAGAARLIAVSDGLAESLANYTDRSIRVIPNMVREQFLETPVAPTPERPPQPFRFLSVGRSDPIKGWDLLIRAYAELTQDGLAASLELCGGEPGIVKLKRLADELGVGDRVTFLGNLSHEAVLDRIRRCDCHVLASRAETFGIVSIEALALGKPIVMSPTYAARTIIRHENGFIADGFTSRDLAEAMRKVLVHWNGFDSESIRQDCRSRFSEEVICTLLTETYREAISGVGS